MNKQTKQTIIQMPDPSLQHQKTPAWVRRLIHNVDPTTGQETIEAIKTLMAEGAGEAATTIRWHEFTAKLRQTYENATLAQIKTFYQTIADEPYPASATQSKLAVAKAIVKIYYPDFDLSGTAAEILSRLEDRVKDEGELGVGCPACGQFHTLKPSVDMQGYDHTDPDVAVDRMTDGSTVFVCPCGQIIKLQP